MYQNFDNYTNPLLDHLKRQQENQKRKSNFRGFFTFLIGFGMGILAYHFYKENKSNREDLKAEV